jgi:hypothetical protein
MLIIHMWAATISRKTKKARLRMLSGKLNVIVLMTDGAANHLHVIAPTDTKVSPIPCPIDSPSLVFSCDRIGASHPNESDMQRTVL